MKTNFINIVKASFLLLSLGLVSNAQAIPSQQINILCTESEGCGDYTGTTADGTIFEANANPTEPATGTGVFQPFVRIQDSRGTQDGYNTDKGEPDINGDTKAGTWTHSVLFSDLGTVDIGGESYFQFSLDANENGSASSIANQIDITGIQLFRGGEELAFPEDNGGYMDGASPTLAGYDAIWTLDSAANGDVNVTLQASICDTPGQCGSGHGDMDLFILASLLTGYTGDYFGFYTEYDRVGSGFEEWRYLAATDVPEPGMVGLLAIGLLSMVVVRRRRKI